MRETDTPAGRLAAAGIDARKRLGQHFLLDLNLCRRIARIADPPPGALLLEVGPGPGGLTEALLEIGAVVLAIETDPRFLPLLERLGEGWPGRLRIVHADALAIAEDGIGAAGASVAANLPYNIGTPLLVKWLVGPFRPPAMTLMFQKEVAERIVARPGERAYGRLAVLARSICEVRLALVVPASAFTPAPKVELRGGAVGSARERPFQRGDRGLAAGDPCGVWPEAEDAAVGAGEPRRSRALPAGEHRPDAPR